MSDSCSLLLIKPQASPGPFFLYHLSGFSMCVNQKVPLCSFATPQLTSPRVREGGRTSDPALSSARPCAFLWKSSGSGRRRRPVGQPQPPRLRQGLLRLGPKVNEVESESRDCGVLHGSGGSGSMGICGRRECFGVGLCGTWHQFHPATVFLSQTQTTPC